MLRLLELGFTFTEGDSFILEARFLLILLLLLSSRCLLVLDTAHSFPLKVGKLAGVLSELLLLLNILDVFYFANTDVQVTALHVLVFV